MPRYSEKSQYKIKAKRYIYILHSPLSGEYYIGHCQINSLMPIFRQHCAGGRYQTKACFEGLKKQSLHPCLHILEEIYSTQVEAYRHVIAWTKIFFEAGYTNLDQGNVSIYINDLFDSSLAIYNSKKNTELKVNYNCDTCIVSNYGRKKCPLYKGESE